MTGSPAFLAPPLELSPGGEKQRVLSGARGPTDHVDGCHEAPPGAAVASWNAWFCRGNPRTTTMTMLLKLGLWSLCWKRLARSHGSLFREIYGGTGSCAKWAAIVQSSIFESRTNWSASVSKALVSQAFCVKIDIGPSHRAAATTGRRSSSLVGLLAIQPDTRQAQAPVAPKSP